MKCEAVQSLLAEHVEGGLTDPHRLGVETHLAGCSTCQAEFKALSGVRELLDAAPSPLVALDAAKLREEALRRADRQARRWRRWACVAAAAAILAIGLAVLPRLEVSLERDRLTVAWGDREPVGPVLAPSSAEPRDEERLQRLEQLVRAVAVDVQNRDGVQQQELIRLQIELERVRQEAVRFRVSTEQDVSSLTRYLQQSVKDKGDQP